VLDSGFMLLSLAGISMPIFWLGLMIWTFACYWAGFRRPGALMHGFPLTRSAVFTSSGLLTRHWQAFWNALWHLVLPA
jgi:ABC-type dipeptide/oligopeptide/nickel transport system permease component